VTDAQSADKTTKPTDLSVQSLTATAGSWIQDALSAWVKEDQNKVATMATIAVEHLGKALLWKTGPVLVLPLDKRHDALLVELVTKPELASPRLRTIGLEHVISRTRRLLGALPVPEDRCQRVVNARNGAIHVGTHEQSREILTDCLSLITTLSEALEHPAKVLYGDFFNTASVLLSQHEDAVAKVVAEKRARARHRLTEFENSLGEEAFQAAMNELERKARDEADEMLRPTEGAVEHACPECGSVGMLYGDIDLTATADWDFEHLGGGHYDHYLVGGWDIALHPRGFSARSVISS